MLNTETINILVKTINSINDNQSKLIDAVELLTNRAEELTKRVLALEGKTCT